MFGSLVGTLVTTLSRKLSQTLQFSGCNDLKTGQWFYSFLLLLFCPRFNLTAPWQHMSVLVDYFLFDSWEELFDKIAHRKKKFSGFFP